MLPLGVEKLKKNPHMLVRHGKIPTSALWTEIKIDSRLKVQWLPPLAPAVLNHHENTSTS